MFGLGVPELLFIMMLALLIFGPKRLPQIGRTLGKGMAEFRKASTELQRSINTELDFDSPPPRRPPAKADPPAADEPATEPPTDSAPADGGPAALAPADSVPRLAADAAAAATSPGSPDDPSGSTSR